MVAHRVAYLLRVARINPKAILVLCFNRSAILTLRQRLRDLVGDDMAGVTLLTFHGLALRLTGRSLVTQAKQGRRKEIDFSEVITEAIRLLQGKSEVMGLQDIPPDVALVGRFSHILVDEYQDIDAEQYELVSLVAGKSREESDRKLAIFAVGDDDQNIYRFRGASVAFIRQFQQDYSADVYSLIENYRSTAHIIAAANCLIAHNTDRMKTSTPIRVNKARQNLPPGGNWQVNDPVTRGKVQILEVADPGAQATVVLGELQRLQRAGLVESNRCAILAREWKDLDIVRSVCEKSGVPVSVCWGRHSSFPRLSSIEENANLLDQLRTMQTETCSGGNLLAMLEHMAPVQTVWRENLHRLLLDWMEETNNVPQPVPAIQEYLYEVLAEQGRTKSMGNGLVLATAHAVKGLEFDHVFILGDSWRGGDQPTLEDERRLYYVAMSRARETLHLFLLDSAAHPHLSLLQGDFLMRRRPSVSSVANGPFHSYHLLGLEDFYLDFLGRKPEQHPSRLAGHQVKAGSVVQIELRNGHLELVNRDGVAFARLSRKAQAKWMPRLGAMQEIRIVALARRSKDEIVDKALQARCKGTSWHVPIVEVVC